MSKRFVVGSENVERITKRVWYIHFQQGGCKNDQEDLKRKIRIDRTEW